MNTVEPPVSDHPNVKPKWSFMGGGCSQEVRPQKLTQPKMRFNVPLVFSNWHFN